MWGRMNRDERIAAVRAGVKDGLSTSQIAAAIGGCTRNSVIGLAHRVRIELTFPRNGAPKKRAAKEVKPKRITPAKQETPTKLTRAPEPLTTALVKKMPVIVDSEPTYEFPDIHYRVHLEDVKSGQCRRPTWNDDKRPDVTVYFYCGKPVRAGSSYCWHCHKRMYDGAPPKREPRTKPSARLTRRGEIA
ncbi:MAG: hypothetical protein E5W82_10405 [Mesorhizobium sp.]|nr:MAG: hypothetical protein E5W82_10405 [Mesorhizobium sp.]